jgi:hypothetical protein
MASPPSLDGRLRSAAGPEPDTERALAEVMRRVRHRTWRRVAVMMTTVAVAVGFAAAVRAVDQDSGGPDVAVRTTDAPAEGSPHLLPAPGWEISLAGLTAANVSLGPNSRAGAVPWDTVERLKDGDIVLFAMLVPVGETSAVDSIFPPRELPLSLDDAQLGGLEGQPDDVYAERLLAQVDGWNIDLLIFYGSTALTGEPPAPAPPSPETRAAAQEQLARLVVPAHEVP